MENQSQTQQEDTSKRSWSNHWHGVVQAIIIIATLVFVWHLACMVSTGDLQIYDAILAIETILFFSIAMVYSHAYNYRPNSAATDLQEEAAKLKATWLHANFCWKMIKIWMAITSLYCTCATIYISGTSIGSEWDQVHVLAYSIISLVLSLGVYVIRPSNQEAGYRKAYLSITMALYGSGSEEELKNAIIEGEAAIAKEASFDPQ